MTGSQESIHFSYTGTIRVSDYVCYMEFQGDYISRATIQKWGVRILEGQIREAKAYSQRSMTSQLLICTKDRSIIDN